TLSAWARGSEWTIQRAAVADSRSPARATGIVGQGEPGQIGNRRFRRLAWLGFGFGLGVRNLLGRCVEFRCSGRQCGLWGRWSRADRRPMVLMARLPWVRLWARGQQSSGAVRRVSL